MNDAVIHRKPDGWEYEFDDFCWDGSHWTLTVKCEPMDSIDYAEGVNPAVARVWSHADVKAELPWRSLPQGFRDQIEDDVAANYRHYPEEF